MISLKTLPEILPKLKSHQQFALGQLNATNIALLLKACLEKYKRPIFCVTRETQQIDRVSENLNFFYTGQRIPLYLFPDWEILPYDRLSPHSAITSARLSTLYHLPTLKEGVVLSSITTLLAYLTPKKYLFARALSLKLGDVIDLMEFKKQLERAEYIQVDQVREHGEYAQRGAIIDVYPMGSRMPYRIEWFDDEVSSIRLFDIETQLSSKKIEAVELLPAHEYSLSADRIKHFRENWRAKFAGNPLACPMYVNVSDGRPSPGAEYYLPLFFDEKQTIFDYLPENTLIIYLDDLNGQAKTFWQELNHRYSELSGDRTHPLCAPCDIFMPVEHWFQKAKDFTRVILKDSISNKHEGVELACQCLPNLSFDTQLTSKNRDLKTFKEKHQGRLLFLAQTKGRCQIILELLKTLDIFPVLYETWVDFLNTDEKIGIIVSPLEESVLFDDVALITESQLFGEHVYQRRRRTKSVVNVDYLIENLSELKVGDPVVHIEHGIGRYQGLTQIKTSQHEAEYITVTYAHGDKIYVPITSMHLLTRYTGTDMTHVPLHALGKRQWEKEKEKAIKRVHDVAAELLDVYSRREASKGFAFQLNHLDMQRFTGQFPFEETEDQLSAIDAVFSDMQQEKYMDRLICGDVGFGKTEIAMRAAFLAVNNHKQVVVLVPTTLLASQHLQNFKDRFAPWPIHIDALYRFKTQKEQNEIIAKIADHKIDILIGTHALLNNKVKFKDLGLLILDEEHRFGVRQKEKIKRWRSNIDVLTLTATPIPRTLNMALLGTRDLSIITTPPLRRLSIKTFVRQWNKHLIREAILREMMRGGQVYFLHNDVSTIQNAAKELQHLLPDLNIAVAHGQMSERELEKVMFDFYHHRFQVLICSTIIESGIDVPTANTIIIEKANHFGLAQLHQLRGRVGRSHHQAYAYLLTPAHAQLAPIAKKRLKVISELEDLGAGFYLASHDLEIRGAGELLGESQSGHMQAIGFSLYMDLLKEAVDALKKGKEPTLTPLRPPLPEINMNIIALLPETYMVDVNQRLVFYKRLTVVKTQEVLFELKSELIDRFGALPPPAQTLFQLTELKLLAKQLGIKEIYEKNGYFYFHLEEKLTIDIDKLIGWISSNTTTHQLKGYTLRIKHECETSSLIDTLADLLQCMYTTMFA
jgi:transcription-repair coupling factor (superfamily II helicase)